MTTHHFHKFILLIDVERYRQKPHLTSHATKYRQPSNLWFTALIKCNSLWLAGKLNNSRHEDKINGSSESRTKCIEYWHLCCFVNCLGQ